MELIIGHEAWIFLAHWIESARVEWMAAQQTAQAHPDSPQDAVRSTASIMYSEQVGENRQADGK